MLAGLGGGGVGGQVVIHDHHPSILMTVGIGSLFIGPPICCELEGRGNKPVPKDQRASYVQCWRKEQTRDQYVIVLVRVLLL